METTRISTCKHHGDTVYVMRKDGRYRCRACSVDSVTSRRKALKKMAVDYKGGCCSMCGYDKCISALEFHHLNPNEKDFHLGGKYQTASWDKIRSEIDKCVLLCANCHREIHAETLVL